MREIRLRRLIWAIAIGTFALIVAIVLIWKFRFYDQVNVDLANSNQKFETAKADAAALKDNLEEAALEKQKFALAQDQLTYFRERFRTMPFDLSDEGKRNATWIRYMNEYFYGFGVAARDQLIQAANDTGVTITTKIQVEQPPQMPENVVAPASGFLKPTEENKSLDMVAVGTYPDLLRFFDRLNRSPILLVVGNIKMEGTSPSIKATFQVTPYMLTSGVSALVSAPPGGTAPAGGGTPGTPGAPGAPGPNGPPGARPSGAPPSGAPAST